MRRIRSVVATVAGVTGGVLVAGLPVVRDPRPCSEPHFDSDSIARLASLSESPAVAAAPEIPPAAAFSAVPWGALRLEGRLEGVDRDIAARSSVTLVARDPFGVGAVLAQCALVRRDGSFEADLSLVPTRSGLGSLVDVRVENDACETVAELVRCRDGETAPRTVRLDVRLAPAVVSTGRIVDDAGAPIAGAAAAAFARRSSLERMTLRSSGVTDANGRYRLRVPLRADVVVTAASPGRRPAAAPRFDPEYRDAASDLPDLVLSSGESISGRLTVNGVAVRKALVSAEASRAGLHGYAERFGTIALDGDRVARTTMSSAVAADGGFRIGGLFRRTYRLVVRYVDGAHASLWTTAATIDVPAPTAGVAIDLRAGRVDFDVRSNGTPRAGAVVQFLSDSASQIVRTDAGGRASLLVAPGERIHLIARGEGGEDRRCGLTEFDGPSVGETVTASVDLLPTDVILEREKLSSSRP